jgi:KDO2-lipid IV(A) lauroyltransferase
MNRPATEIRDPFALRVLYALAAATAWIAFRVLGLRREVVRGNLERSLPEWTTAQRKAVEREFVRRQGEFLAELLYTPRLDAAAMRERVVLENPEVLAAAMPSRPAIVIGAHHCNSEWGMQRLSLEFGERLVGLYKPIRNRRVDAWFRQLRSRFGSRLIPAKSVLMELARRRDASCVGLIADQAPTTSPDKHWTTFLGQDTAFYMGPELLGRALRGHALLARMHRLARGRYGLRFVPLNAPGERLPPGEVTERYARALESWIRDDPAGWWWSHKRWKLKPPPSAIES